MISFVSFMKLVDQRDNGQSTGFGWGIYEGINCPSCEIVMAIHVAQPYTKGFKCKCGYEDKNFFWPPRMRMQDGPFLNPVLENTSIFSHFAQMEN